MSEVIQEFEVTKINQSQDISKAMARNLAAMETELGALKLNNRKLTSENERLKAEVTVNFLSFLFWFCFMSILG